MKTFFIFSMACAFLVFNASAQTAAIGKYRTSENLEKAFLTNLRTIPLTKFTLKSSDKTQGTIQANQIDGFAGKEFASVFILVSQETNSVLIEATFTRNSGFIGGGKPVDWAKTYGEKLKVALPDLKVEITDVKKK